MDKNAYRSASETDFPRAKPGGKVCYFEMVDGVVPTQLHYIDDFRGAVQRAITGETMLFAVWPGQYRSDLFHIDNPQILADL